MGLFDVIDQIAENQIMKTETGDNRVFGVMVGVVAKNYDKDMPGSVCVTIPVMDKEMNELQWARVAMPSSGKRWGSYFLPEVGDQVLLAFEQGNLECPYVIGCIPKDSNRFLRNASDENNKIKQIMTKNGNTILFEDEVEGEGEKDKISIMTAKEAHVLELDNEHHKIILRDKKNKNGIEMQTENGSIKITAESSLTIQVGDNIKLKMNGNSGNVTLECSKLTMKTSGNTVVDASGSFRASGGNVTLEANSMLKASSSGAAIFSGAPIKMG